MSEKPTDTQRYFDPMLPRETLFQILEDQSPEPSNVEWLLDRQKRPVRDRGREWS